MKQRVGRRIVVEAVGIGGNMPLYNNLLIDRDREEGTIGSETMENIGNYLGTQYEKLPEDFRTGLKEGTANNIQAIQEWNRQKREENYWGGIGPLDPVIGAVKAYDAVASPIKKEVSIRTGLAPSVVELGEVGLDLLTPGIPLAAKKIDNITDALNPKIWKRKGRDFVKLTPEEAYPNWDPELGGYALYSKADDVDLDAVPVKITERDLPGPQAGSESPLPAWGVTESLTGQENIDLARIVYEGSIETSDRLSDITNYKLGGQASFQKWARDEYVPLMNAAAEELGMGLEPFYSLVASRPGFKYIEHRIAKNEGMKWYWDMVGDPNVAWDVKANHIDNLRLLLDDRFKQLKDAVEVQVYGGSAGTGGINSIIPNRANRYIVDIQSPSSGRRYSALEQNAGDVVIRKAGSGEEVGRIGEYYSVLFSKTDDLLQRLPQKFPELKGLSRKQQKDWIREWRTGIINEHLDIIRRKEGALKGLSEQAKFEKIELALYEDMVNFRQEYESVLPWLSKGFFGKLKKDMTYSDILEIKKLTYEDIPRPDIGVKVKYNQKTRRGSLIEEQIEDFLQQILPERAPFKDLTKTSERKYIQKKRMKGGGTIE